MVVMIISCVVLGLYALCNVSVALMYSPKTLIREMWLEQPWYGKISANIFYAPAWVLMGASIALVFLAYWLVKGIAIGTWWLVNKMFTVYEKAIRLEL